MANYFTVRTRKDFNTRLWTRAAVDRQYNYKQGYREDRRVLSTGRGEPLGQNDGKKNYHLNFVQHWWCFEEVLAEAECRPLNYTLVLEPPAPHSGKEEQPNGAKLLAFYRHILELFDADDEPVQGINTQVEKGMLGFFEDLLAAQFADCPKRLQEYSMLSAADKDAIKAVAKRIDTKVRERIRGRDAYSETLGAALTEQDMLKYYNLTAKQTKGHNWANVLSLKALFAHMFLNANRSVREIRLLLSNVVDEELDRAAKVALSGASTSRLLVHGFALQAGGPGAQDKLRGTTARWELDGFLRHAILELCAASKMADYMLLRFRDLPLQFAIVSAEALLDFLDKPFFMRHRHGMPPKPYSKDTIKNVLMGSGQGDGLECRAGLARLRQADAQVQAWRCACSCRLTGQRGCSPPLRKAQRQGARGQLQQQDLVPEARDGKGRRAPRRLHPAVPRRDLVQHRAGPCLQGPVRQDHACERCTAGSSRGADGGPRRVGGRAYDACHAAQLHRHHAAGPGGVVHPSCHGPRLPRGHRPVPLPAGHGLAAR